MYLMILWRMNMEKNEVNKKQWGELHKNKRYRPKSGGCRIAIAIININGDAIIVPRSEMIISMARFKKRCSMESPRLRQSKRGVSNRKILSAPFIIISDIFGVT